MDSSASGSQQEHQATKDAERANSCGWNMGRLCRRRPMARGRSEDLGVANVEDGIGQVGLGSHSAITSVTMR